MDGIIFMGWRVGNSIDFDQRMKLIGLENNLVMVCTRTPTRISSSLTNYSLLQDMILLFHVYLPSVFILPNLSK